jgi:hypothetical protein
MLLSIVGCNTADAPLFVHCDNLTVGEVIDRLAKRYRISDTIFMGEFPTYDALSLYENRKCVAEIDFDRLWSSDSAKRISLGSCVRAIRVYDPGNCFAPKQLRAVYQCECSADLLRMHVVDTKKSG